MAETLKEFIQRNKWCVVRNRKSRIPVPDDILIKERLEVFCLPFGKNLVKLVENFYESKGYKKIDSSPDYKFTFEREDDKLKVVIDKGFPYFISSGKKKYDSKS